MGKPFLKLYCAEVRQFIFLRVYFGDLKYVVYIIIMTFPIKSILFAFYCLKEKRDVDENGKCLIESNQIGLSGLIQSTNHISVDDVITAHFFIEYSKKSIVEIVCKNLLSQFYHILMLQIICRNIYKISILWSLNFVIQ